MGVVDLCMLSWCQGSAIAMLLLHCRQGSAWKLMLLWLPAGKGENTAGFWTAPTERMDSVTVDRLETVPGGLVTSDLLLTFSVLSPLPGLHTVAA